MVIIILLVLGFVLSGFKITYNPLLDNSWEAISACASWVSVVVSGLALWYAIQIPKKIAEGQNRIALYDKRYSLLIELEHCFSYAYLLENLNDTGESCSFFFEIAFVEENYDEKDLININSRALFYKAFNTLKQAEFLFDKNISKEIIDLSGKLSLLLESDKRKKSIEKILEIQELYIEQSKKVEEFMPQIYDQLKLG